LEGVLLGLQQFQNPMVWVALVGGTLLGLIVGSLPGLNDTITIAILIPVTFGMNSYVALSMLVGIYVASACGGSIPAILLNIPGTASSMVTTLDGYPMTQQGRGGLGLSLSVCSSVFGGISSSIVLLLFAPILARFALKFGPPEYFMLAILGMSTVVGMAGHNIAKNFLSMGLGLFISMIGMSPETGVARFTLGSQNLMDGISLVPMMIGFFGVLSVLKLVDATKKKKDDKLPAEPQVTVEDKIGLLDRKMTKRVLPTWLKSSAIGNLIGIIPGAGMVMAIFLAYDQAKKSHPKLKFGTGVPEGVAAPETANNSVVASSMVPLLSLGIPGNGTSALFLGALTIQGLQTGPTLFKDSPAMAYMIIFGFLFANIVMLPMSLTYCKRLASKVLKIKPEILSAAITLLCVTGAFSCDNNVFQIGVTVVFGLIAYLFWKFDLPQAPLILAMILGSMMESNWASSMVYANGSISVFFTRPISLALVILSIIFLIWPVIQRMLYRRKNMETAV
jgi:putative tricarboxylic transport membrane protein